MRTARDAAAAQLAANDAISHCETLGGSVCFTVASLQANGSFVPKDVAKAEASAKRACDTGSMYACFVQGMSAAESGDHARARALYETACAADLAQACFNLGVQSLEGTGGAKDVARGKTLVRSACALGDGKACDYLAATNDGAVPVERADTAYATTEDALQANLRYCDAGGADACVTAAFSLGAKAEQSGELEGMERVLALLQMGCSRSVAGGCNVLGHIVRDAKKACAANDPGQCLVLGYAYSMGVQLPRLSGAGVPKDEERARDAFVRACAGGLESACRRVGSDADAGTPGDGK